MVRGGLEPGNEDAKRGKSGVIHQVLLDNGPESRPTPKTRENFLCARL